MTEEQAERLLELLSELNSTMKELRDDIGGAFNINDNISDIAAALKNWPS